MPTSSSSAWNRSSGGRWSRPRTVGVASPAAGTGAGTGALPAKKRKRAASPPRAPAPGAGHVDPPSGEPDEFVFDLDLNEVELESDSMMLIRALQAAFYRSRDPAMALSGGLVLRHQLYTLQKNRTAVDQELQQLKSDNVVRHIKLLTGGDDVALVPTDHYLERAQQVVPPAILEVLRALLESNRGMYVQATDIGRSIPETSDLGVQDVTSALVRAGFLLPRRDVRLESDAFWLSHPRCGFMVTELRSGRSELLSVVSRSRYKEMREVELGRKPLKLSRPGGLGLAFHLADLLGVGKLQRMETAAGTFMRLTC